MKSDIDSPLQSPKTAHDKAIGEFLRYWKGMRRHGDVPRRSDIDPRGIEPLLSNAFIVERIAPGLARLRIAGTHLSDLMGMEVRGMPLSAFFNTAHRDTLAHALVQVFDSPATVQMEIASKGRPGAPGLTGKLVILPLRSDLGDVSRALGCLVTTGNTGRGPRRFDIDAVHYTNINLSTDAALRCASDAPQPEVPLRGFAEQRPAPLTKSERPYLRLVKSV
ncbi:PAS domain-containing protein [Rhodobacteraceae bacterium KMM 6894]|nr:PAS domain-containing protein [Rhodobacteraceae bacterium KMM 6894]